MPDSTPEGHLLVFWRWPADGLENILDRIRERFEINRVVHLYWTEERIVDNFQRFYAMISEHAYQKFTEAGVLPFLFVLVTDHNPVYEYRVATGSGFTKVNVHSFNLKKILRRQGRTSLTRPDVSDGSARRGLPPAALGRQDRGNSPRCHRRRRMAQPCGSLLVERVLEDGFEWRGKRRR